MFNNCKLIHNDQTSMSINKRAVKIDYTNTNEVVHWNKHRVSESNTIHTKQHKIWSMRQHKRKPHVKELLGTSDPSSEANTHGIRT